MGSEEASEEHKNAGLALYLSLETPSELVSFVDPLPFELDLLSLDCSLVCIRRLAVRTNWPTAAEKPLKKALKGYVGRNS